MRVQYIRIDKYDWDLYVYYCITRTPINDIIEKLIDINCPSSYIKEAYTILSQNRENILQLLNITSIYITNKRFKGEIK